MSLLDELEISPALKARISTSQNSSAAATEKTLKNNDFVLYLPTVNLRLVHNPAFALACHIANKRNVQLIVLAVVLDDSSMPNSKNDSPQIKKQVVMTSRRLAFLLEALSASCKQWSDHGAGVAIRVHGPKARSPDHLTLSSRALAVVTDEPFVNPFVSFVQRTEKACLSNDVPFYRVDGSTTVPPCNVLTKKKLGLNSNDPIYYLGVPAKAWMWKKKTESMRMGHLQAAMRGEFDAPALQVSVENDNFFLEENGKSDCHIVDGISPTTFPQAWRDKNKEAPGSRPWTVSDLDALFEANEIKNWSMTWPGADNNVKPCTQTIGTEQKGMQRWNDFVSGRKGLVYYGRRRNDPVQPHASSRMSCYLNFGIVSIFRLVHEVKMAQASKVSGADKFEEEIVKWREHSYAHAFSRGDYFDLGCAPQWAIRWIERSCSSNSQNRLSESFDIANLETGTTGDHKWDAMQKYLVNTGELHNNCRMTWGKQVVHWGVSTTHEDSNPTKEIMQMLGYLNDRFALDGLSPPSYGGLLWCIGWGDKSDSKGSISKKPASRYKLGPASFQEAESNLMKSPLGKGVGKRGQQTSIISSIQNQKRKSKVDPCKDTEDVIFVETKKSKTLDQYFGKN